MKKGDFVISLIIGEILAWFFIFMDKVGVVKMPYLSILPLIVPIVCAMGLYVSFLIGKKISVVGQLGRFVLVGVLNTVIDFGILNLLIFTTGIFAGFWYWVFKIISSVSATTNSFFWNKFWTFGRRDTAKTAEEASRFLLVTILGILLNSCVAYSVVNFIHPMGGLDAKQWANIGAMTATIVGFLWNFFGYKLIVFKK